VSRRLHEASEASRQAFAVIACDYGLTAVQARFILRLSEPIAMKDLAEHLVCDKSNITGISTRLVERGLVTTKQGLDRRVKLVGLTTAGRRLRAGLGARPHGGDRSAGSPGVD